MTSPVEAKADQPAVYPDDCWASAPFTTHPVCHYGDEDSDERVALIGNSHAGHWQPALDAVADDRGWALDTYLASQCYTVDLDIAFPNPKSTGNCRDWNAESLQRIIDSDPSLVVISNRTRTLPLAGLEQPEADRRGAGRLRRHARHADLRGDPGAGHPRHARRPPAACPTASR